LFSQLNSKLFRQREHSLVRFPNTPGKVVEERLASIVLLGLHPPSKAPPALVNLDIGDAGLDQPERSVQTGYTAANLCGDRPNTTNRQKRMRNVIKRKSKWSCQLVRHNPAKGQPACLDHTTPPHATPLAYAPRQLRDAPALKYLLKP
jgi:hypothetical protein